MATRFLILIFVVLFLVLCLCIQVVDLGGSGFMFILQLYHKWFNCVNSSFLVFLGRVYSAFFWLRALSFASEVFFAFWVHVGAEEIQET